MTLPQLLMSSFEKEISNISIQKLQKAYSVISNNYRLNRKDMDQNFTLEEQRLSYIVARMPSTYETVCKVLTEINSENSEQIESILDIGAGPGTASWACCETFDTIKNITLVEYNADMALLGKKIAQNHPILKNANWIMQDILNSKIEFTKADLVIASYSFNEIEDKYKEHILKFLLDKTNKYLVIVDPGTPESFKSIHFARKWFLENNTKIVAPCSHSQKCPAFEQQDWCHFYTRVQRTQLHKILKEGEKGYEDEKFSYIIVSKVATNSYESRIIRHPDIHSGHLKLNLCTSEGFETSTYSKKNGAKYKKARKSDWGDRWEINNFEE